MPETTEKKPATKKPATKKAAPKPKVPMRAQGDFADQFDDDGYEIGYLDLTALHQWNKSSDFTIVVEHPQTGKPTQVLMKPGIKIKTWKRVYFRFDNAYHKLTQDSEGNETKELGFIAKWEPIYEGDE